MSFPPNENADPDGLLAVGGDLSVERLLQAYKRGIFPWYGEGDPILWWSPPKRMVLYPCDIKISKSMRKLFKDNAFEVSYNKCFEKVINCCAQKKRKGQEGTWISKEIVESYTQLHKMGRAISVEVWEDKDLVGGLYGVDMGNVFCGESMFSNKSNASKFGFISFVRDYTRFEIIDCQVYSKHLESLGGREIPREDFLKYLNTI